MHWTMPSGAPAAFAACWITWKVSRMQFLALGWGLMTMAFPALREISDLYITVDVGLVDGIRAATTPMGTATSIRPRAVSSRRMPTVFISRMLS